MITPELGAILVVGAISVAITWKRARGFREGYELGVDHAFEMATRVVKQRHDAGVEIAALEGARRALQREARQ